jgi:hypothetical protein
MGAIGIIINVTQKDSIITREVKQVQQIQEMEMWMTSKGCGGHIMLQAPLRETTLFIFFSQGNFLNDNFMVEHWTNLQWSWNFIPCVRIATRFALDYENFGVVHSKVD